MVRTFRLLSLLCGLSTAAWADLSDRTPDWSLILQQVRTEVGLGDIRENAGKTTGTWRFTYTQSLALDSPKIVTIEEQEDGSARVLVTTEDTDHQRYRVAEYDRQWMCGTNSGEGFTISCLPLPPKPTGPQYQTIELPASKDDIARLRNLFAAVPICEEPDIVARGYDGSDWYYETADGAKYCMDHRWSPSAGDIDPNGEAFRQLGLYMSLLARGRIYPM